VRSDVAGHRSSPRRADLNIYIGLFFSLRLIFLFVFCFVQRNKPKTPYINFIKQEFLLAFVDFILLLSIIYSCREIKPEASEFSEPSAENFFQDTK
jgi:hypothetical protein